MKKFFTLAATALVAMSANAEFNFMNQHESITAPVKMEKVQMQGIQKKAPAQKQDVDATFEAFLGDFVHSQWALDPETYTDWVASNPGMQISDNGDGTVTMTNFLGFGDIVATYDADDQALYADPGQFLFTSTYGSVSVFPFFVNDDDEAEIDEESPLIFMLDDENRFEMLNDGVVMVLTDGAYEGYRINYLYMFNQFDRVNGTMSWTSSDNVEETVGVSIENKIADKGYVNVYGFSNLGCAMIGVEGEEVQLYNGQGFFFHSNYGLFTNQGCSVTDGGYNLIEGEYSGGTYNNDVISLSPYIIYYENTLYDAYIDAQIVLGLNNNPTAISQIKDEQHQQAFDLQGRAASSFQPGQIYMQEGRKFIVK